MYRLTRKRIAASTGGINLNVMPFIDIFSLLCTFLLFSAVFVALGIHTVQVPFFTNAPEKKKPTKPKRSLSIKVVVEKDSIVVHQEWSLKPVDKRKFSYPKTKEGMLQFHQKLVDLRNADVSNNKVTLFFDENVAYQKVISILDSIRITLKNDVINANKSTESTFLFSKVVMGNIIL